MGLLMFLAVTASLLGYCQTDEKGKTQRESRDSTFPSHFPLACLPFLSLPRRTLFHPAAGVRAERNTDFAFRIATRTAGGKGRGRGEGEREGREGAAKINFYGRRHE